MIGFLVLAAASRTAFTVDDDETLNAGIAKPASLAYWKRRRTSSPVRTPVEETVRNDSSDNDMNHSIRLEQYHDTVTRMRMECQDM